jgi:hypothetical protein
MRCRPSVVVMVLDLVGTLMKGGRHSRGTVSMMYGVSLDEAIQGRSRGLGRMERRSAEGVLTSLSPSGYSEKQDERTFHVGDARDRWILRCIRYCLSRS